MYDTVICHIICLIKEQLWILLYILHLYDSDKVPKELKAGHERYMFC